MSTTIPVFDAMELTEVEHPSGKDLWRGVIMGLTPDLKEKARIRRVFPGTDVAINYRIIMFAPGGKKEIPLFVTAGKEPFWLRDLELRPIRVHYQDEVCRASLHRGEYRIGNGTIILHPKVIGGEVRYEYIICHPSCRPDEPAPTIPRLEPVHAWRERVTRF